MTGTPPPSARDRGMVLLNALVMVAALAAVATFLMLKAETSRQRLMVQQTNGQAGLYLDAAETLALKVLEEDMLAAPASDQPDEPWAQPRLVTIDRGQVAILITDLQGRFNVNWLADPSDTLSRQALERLLAGLGLPPGLGGAIAGYVTPRAPTASDAYGARAVPIRVPGGPITLIDDLALVEGMTPEAFARLRPNLAALPLETRLNVGTASAEVLRAFLPRATPAGLAPLIAGRAGRPLASVADFRTRTEAIFGPTTFDQIDSARFGLTSRWFSVTLAATLGTTRRVRQLIVRRIPAEGLATIIARLEDQR